VIVTKGEVPEVSRRDW